MLLSKEIFFNIYMYIQSILMQKLDQTTIELEISWELQMQATFVIWNFLAAALKSSKKNQVKPIRSLYFIELNISKYYHFDLQAILKIINDILYILLFILQCAFYNHFRLTSFLMLCCRAGSWLLDWAELMETPWIVWSVEGRRKRMRQVWALGQALW